MSTEEKKITEGEEANKAAAPKSVTVRAGDDETSILQQRDEIEHRIQVQGRENPDTFKMPTGGTLTETRRKMAEQQREEGIKALSENDKHVREQSIAGDPLYQSGAQVRFNEGGSSAIVEAPAVVSTSEKISMKGPERRELETPGSQGEAPETSTGTSPLTPSQS